MKTYTTSCLSLTKSCFNNFASNAKILFVLFMLLGIAKFGNAQTQAHCDSIHDAPSCNLVGPLKACLYGGEIAITATIDFSSSNPGLDFNYAVNTTGSTLDSQAFVSYIDSEYIEVIYINPGNMAGSINLQMDVSVTYPDGCVLTCECSKSITIRKTTGSATFPPILCNGGTTTLTVVGGGASTYQYTIQPGDTNTTGIFTNVGTGTYTVTVLGTKEGLTCDTAFLVNIPQPPPNPVQLNCPSNVNTGSCQSQTTINSLFQTWVNQFSTSGGTNPVVVNNITQTPPSICGGTVTFYDSVYSDCQSPVGCSSTFTIANAPTVNLTCPNNFTDTVCHTQTQINNDFTAWLATASGSGGCNGSLSHSSASAPDACAGGTTTVTFTYTSSCAPTTTTCSSTFSVPASPTVKLTCPNNFTDTVCHTQTQINSDFTAWLATASGSGGCNGSLSHSTASAPNACSGGTTTVTFTYTSTCTPTTTTCSATFTVPASPTVKLTCPNNFSDTVCHTQTQINNDFTAWLATASGSGGCNGNLSHSSASAPDACAGGTTTVTFTYTSTCTPTTSTCSATFTVPAPATVKLTCPNNFTDTVCHTQTQINNDFTAWLATASGSGGCNGNLSHSSASAPDACAGGTTTVTFTYTSTCAPATTTCSATFSVPASPTVKLTCPNNFTDTVCHTQSQINADFTAWLATASGSGGCNGNLSHSSASAPDACAGGTTTVTFTYTSTCTPTTTTCSATFSVPASPTVKLTCPNNFTDTACHSQTQINNDFTAWLATASGSGGCNGSLSHSSASAPNACTGGTSTVTFTYTSTCTPTTTTCSATFSVPASPAVKLNCPNNFTDTMCHTQSQINADFTAWLATASGSGGCNGSLSHSTASAPDACAGGTSTVTFSYTSTCGSTTCTATFNVPASPTVKLTCPNNFTDTVCHTQTQINTDFTAWLATASGSGGCNGNLSHSSASAPDACAGGTTTVTFTYTSTCTPTTTTCSATFSVPASPTVRLTCPNNFTDTMCHSQSKINADFTAWLATASGSGGCNGSLSHSSASAPDACAGGTTTVTFTYTSTCTPTTTTCSATFTVPASPTVRLTCPNNFTDTVCHTQSQINADFTAWLATASGSGGCNGNLSHSSASAPDACAGGTTTVTFTYTSTCTPTTTTCSATFSVPASPTVKLTCPNNFTDTMCHTQSQINNDFTAWLATASGSGGCNGNLSHSSASAPDACAGGTTTVIFTYSSTCTPTTTTCSATFTVPASPTVRLTCPNNFTDTACHTQSQINADFTAWLATASGSGGCNGSLGHSNASAPDACSGGTTTVSFSYTSTCSAIPTTCSATFTVPASPTVHLNCPNNFTESGPRTQAQINSDFAAWLASASGSGGCNGNLSHSTPVIPDACLGGTATVTFTYTSTCAPATSTCSATFTVPPSTPPANCSNTGTINCTNPTQSVSVNSCDGAANRSYSWTGPGGFTSTFQCASVTVGGTYSVTVTNTLSNCTATCTTTVNYDKTPPPANCGGGNINCITPTTQITVNSCDNAENRTYSWTAPGNYSSTSQCPVVSDSGTYTVVVENLNNGCTSTCSAHVSKNTTKPIITLTAPTTLPICGSTGNSLCASSTGSSLSYAWTVSGTGWSITSSTTGSCVTYTAGSGGSATFTVIVTDGTNGCSSTASVTFACQLDLWGCTLGFWKNHVSIWDQSSQPIPQCIAAAIASYGAGYSGDGTINSSYATTFGVTAAQMTAVGLNPSLTLLQALNLGGGGVFNMSRQGVAALLNGCGLSGHYKYNSIQVIALMHNAIVTNSNLGSLGDQLDAINSAPPDNCPPAGKATKRLVNGGVVYDEYVMMSAYPNPFGDKTTIEVMPSIDFNNAIVELYNISGQKVSTIYTGSVLADQTYHFDVNAENLTAGVYIYTFKAGDEAIYGKVILIK